MTAAASDRAEGSDLASTAILRPLGARLQGFHECGQRVVDRMGTSVFEFGTGMQARDPEHGTDTSRESALNIVRGIADHRRPRCLDFKLSEGPLDRLGVGLLLAHVVGRDDAVEGPPEVLEQLIGRHSWSSGHQAQPYSAHTQKREKIFRSKERFRLPRRNKVIRIHIACSHRLHIGLRERSNGAKDVRSAIVLASRLSDPILRYGVPIVAKRLTKGAIVSIFRIDECAVGVENKRVNAVQEWQHGAILEGNLQVVGCLTSNVQLIALPHRESPWRTCPM